MNRPTFASWLALPMGAAFILHGQMAQGETTAETWTLARIVSRAAEVSPQLRASENEVIAAEGQAHQAGRWENPEISLGAGPMKYSVLNGTSYSASVSQEVPVFGQKSTAAAAERQGQVLAEKNRDLSKLTLKHTVAILAYELLAAEIRSQHTAHRKESISLIGQYLSTRPFASPAQAVEKTLIQNRIREIEEKFLEANANRKKRWQDLNVYLDLKSEIAPTLKWFDAGKNLNPEEIRATILSQHPEIQRQEIALTQSALLVDQANTKSYPGVRLGATYNYQSVDQPQSVYNGVLSLSLPLWDAGGGSQKAANARKAIEESKLETARRQAAADFETAWSDLDEDSKRLDLYPLKLVDSLENEMKKAEANWRKGLVPVTAFLELETQVHEQANRVYEAQVAYAAALSRVLLLAGREFPGGDQ